MTLCKSGWFRRAVLGGALIIALTILGARPLPADPGVVVSGSGATNPQSNDPMMQVQSGVNEVIDVFKVPTVPLEVRREKLRELGAKYFDFNSMSRSVMGYHWRDLTPAQREEFVAVFTRFIEDAYLSKLADYTVQKVADELSSIKIQFTRETFDGTEYAQVYSTISVKEQKDPIAINYLMHLADGKWKVYDVTVDAISVIANYRNQINRSMNQNGYDRLIAELRSKTAALQQQLDNPGPARPQ